MATTYPSADCPLPFDALRIVTESLGDDLFVEASAQDIALNLIPRETYPMGTGLVQSVFTVGRSEPTTDEPAVSPIELTSGEDYTGSCATSYADVPIGFNEDTYSPEGFGWQGPVICQDDLIYSHKSAQFWEKYIPAMAKHSAKVTGNRLFAIYDHLVPKSVANTDYHTVDGGTGQPPQSPDLTLDESLCELNQEMLDATAIELTQEGANNPNSSGWMTLGPSGPLYSLYIGMEESQRLMLTNAELRDDLRWAYSGKGADAPLLNRLGATNAIRNFRHVINMFPPRYTYAAGEYTRVPTWIMVAGTKGTVAQINPDWKSAPYEGARVLSPWVFHSQVIKPVTSVAGMTWRPKSYMGEWTFIVGGYRFSPACADPLDKLGRHMAEYKHAPKPIFPKYGRLIIFKRCNLSNYACTTCS